MVSTFSERLRALRDHVPGLSARELARLAGLRSEASVSFVESGHTDSVHLHSAGKLARALGVSLDWLESGRGDTPTPEVVRAAIKAARVRHASERSE